MDLKWNDEVRELNFREEKHFLNEHLLCLIQLRVHLPWVTDYRTAVVTLPPWNDFIWNQCLIFKIFTSNYMLNWFPSGPSIQERILNPFALLSSPRYESEIDVVTLVTCEILCVADMKGRLPCHAVSVHLLCQYSCTYCYSTMLEVGKNKYQYSSYLHVSVCVYKQSLLHSEFYSE